MRPRLGIEAAASGDDAWQELIDVSCWPHWGPTVRSAPLDDGAGVLSAGSTGSVQTSVGVWLPFRVEHWQDDGPQRSWSWSVAGVYATEHSVISTGPSQCRIEMSVPWWAPGYLAVVGVALRRIRSRVERTTGD